MEPAVTLYPSILLLGAAHGLFLALALVNAERGDRLAHRLLALLILTFALDLAVDFLNQSRYLVYAPKLVYLEDFTSFLYGPLTYFYVRAVTSPAGFQLSAQSWMHFVPVGLSVVLLIPFYVLSEAQTIELIYADADADANADAHRLLGFWYAGRPLVQLSPIPLIGAYLALSVRLLGRHKHTICDHFSNIDRITLNWLRNLLIALGALYLVYAVALLLADALVSTSRLEAILNFAVITVIYSMGFMGLRQPAIFTRIDSEPLAAPVVPAVAPEHAATPREKYQKSALDSGMSRSLHEELKHVMATAQPHLDNELTLGKLATQLGISPNYLSQTINEQTGNNFFDYINDYRVQAAKQRLADPDQADQTVLTIAMDAGFNSKSAFYAAFRKAMAMTPTEYRKTALGARAG